MHKKYLLLTLSFILLSCNNNSNSSSSTYISSSVDESNISSITNSESITSSLESSNSSIIYSESINTSNKDTSSKNESFISDSPTQSEEDYYGTPVSRHEIYVSAERYESVYAQGQITAIEQYNTNTYYYNAYLQDDIYGYYLINIPETITLEIGKSYAILALSDNSSTQAKMDLSDEEFVMYQEIEDVSIDILSINEELNENDSTGSLVQFSIKYGDISFQNESNNRFFTYQGYKVLYRSNWCEAPAIENKFSSFNNEQSISITGVLKPRNEIWLSNASLIN